MHNMCILITERDKLVFFKSFKFIEYLDVKGCSLHNSMKILFGNYFHWEQYY